MATRRILFLAAIAILAAACGESSDTSSLDLSDQSPNVAVNDREETPESGEASSTESTAQDNEGARSNPGPDDFDQTVRAADSEYGNTPRYGGGTPQETLGELFDFTAPAVLGDQIVGTDYLGRDLVLWFWAPWCAWCNVEAPRVSTAAQQYGQEVTILGVAGVSSLDAMQAFVGRHELELIDHVADVDGTLWADFDVNYQPWWIFINDDGTVTENWQGRLSDDEIAERIETLVAS